MNGTTKSLTIQRKRKSVGLTPAELKALRKWVDGHRFKTDAADALSISRVTLDRVLLAGTGAPETINTIREALKP